jgi:hypothetical protein
MNKTRVVIFDERGATILINPENLEQYQGAANAVINPSLEAVKGLAPHLWVLKSGKVLPLAEEKQDEHTEKVSGIRRTPPVRRKLWRRCLPLVYALIGASLALAIRAYL